MADQAPKLSKSWRLVSDKALTRVLKILACQLGGCSAASTSANFRFVAAKPAASAKPAIPPPTITTS